MRDKRDVGDSSGRRRRAWARAATSALSALAIAASAADTVSPEKAELIHQYLTCTITTKEPIFNERRSVACGVQSETRYTEDSCPVERYKSCAAESHGVAVWLNATATPGTHMTDWEDGHLSADGCLEKGRQWIASGSPGLEPAGAGVRHTLISVFWQGRDTRDPIFGNRISAAHRCTYTYGFERARYNEARSAACGVESRQVCRVNIVYKLCRDASFGIQSYRQETGALAACGFRVERGYVSVLYDGQLIAKAQVTPVSTAAEKMRADCAEISDEVDRHRCLRVNRAALTLAEPVATAEARAALESLGPSLERLGDQAMIRALSSGDARRQYGLMASTYEKQTFASGVAGIKSFSEEAGQAAQRFADETYFPLVVRLATQALTAGPLDGASEDARAYYDPLYALITDAELSGRRVPSRAISDLLVALRAADPKASPRMRGQVFVLNEFLARLAAAYVDRRAHDIAQLQADAARARRDALKIDEAIAAVSLHVREMKLRLALEETALQQLEAVKASAQLQATIRDLAEAARSDARSTMAAVGAYMQDCAERDGLLKVNMASVHLMRGDVNHALLQLRESGVAFHRLPSAEDRSSFLSDTLERLRRNFAATVRATLARSKATLEKLRSGSELSLDMLAAANGPAAVPFELIDALMEANVAVGDKLDGVRLQLINRIATEVVDPLQEAESQLSK